MKCVIIIIIIYEHHEFQLFLLKLKFHDLIKFHEYLYF